MKKNDISEADFLANVRRVWSVASLIKACGWKVGGGSYKECHRRLAGMDISHFTGQAHLAGKPHISGGNIALPLSEVLVAGRETKSHHLKLRLIKEGLKQWRCEECNETEWRGAPIPICLDHINGDRFDNRIENLRILCPNCHAQTPTFGGKNKGKYGAR